MRVEVRSCCQVSSLVTLFTESEPLTWIRDWLIDLVSPDSLLQALAVLPHHLHIRSTGTAGRHLASLVFYVGAGAPHCSPHTYTTSTLPTGSSPRRSQEDFDKSQNEKKNKTGPCFQVTLDVIFLLLVSLALNHPTFGK